MTGADVSEGSLYDATGQRIRKANLLLPNSFTWVPFSNYEQTGSTSSTATKYYSFGGAVVAMRTGGGSFSYLYGDGVQSTVYTTDASGNVTSARGYRVFGGTRFSEGTMPTDRHFTGQREDATGIYYFNARYYDPQLGMFISPDTIVPDEKNFLSYNRYLYALGNPLKYNDPTGHIAVCLQGGQGAEVDEDGALNLMCRAALEQGGYDPATHGEIYTLVNGEDEIESAYYLIISAFKANEPVIVIGHSWGGSAALSLARMLDEGRPTIDVMPSAENGQFRYVEYETHGPSDIPIDLMILIDIEDAFRGFTPAGSPPYGVTANVATAVNLYASAAADGEGAIWNGLDKVDNAINEPVDLASHYSILNINAPSRYIPFVPNPPVTLNQLTLDKMSGYIHGTLYPTK